MLVSFNPSMTTMSYSKNRNKAQSFTSLKDGKIVAEEVATRTNAMLSIGLIRVGGYKPTVDNLNELNRAKTIAAKDKNIGDSIIDYLDEAIEVLKQKAKEAGISL